jgi:hypothetical protein
MKLTWKSAATLLVLAGVLAIPAISGGGVSCVSTDQGQQGLVALENMEEAEYNKWKLYVSLGVKVAANRLLEEGTVEAEELELAASVLETLEGTTVLEGAQSLVRPALENAGLSNDEVMLVLLVAEQELLSRTPLVSLVDSETGTLSLTPRSKELLLLVAESLRTALELTEEEEAEVERLEVERTQVD